MCDVWSTALEYDGIQVEVLLGWSLFSVHSASLKSRKEQIEMDSRELRKKLKGLRRGWWV